MTFGDLFPEINLDSSIIYVIILTNLIFLASKLVVPTLNIIWSSKIRGWIQVPCFSGGWTHVPCYFEGELRCHVAPGVNSGAMLLRISKKFFFLSRALCCQFLWIVHFGLPLRNLWTCVVYYVGHVNSKSVQCIV
jgi:hypothetical protein